MQRQARKEPPNDSSDRRQQAPLFTEDFIIIAEFCERKIRHFSNI
jgi:hypothetical protein